MSIRSKLKVGGSKVAQAVVAGVLAFGLMPLPAFANDLQAGTLGPQDDATAMDASTGIIAAAYAAANPAPEILGLNNPNQRGTNEADTTYEFFGDPAINENPDPFLYNYKNGLTPGVYVGGRGGGPMARLNAYDTTNPDAAQNAVWQLLPDIILGTGADAIPENEHDFYADDARVVETDLGLDANSYNPIGVTYNRLSLPTMIQTMYRLAAAADEVKAAQPDRTYRYEDPMEIAQNYERYILGQKGLVKQAIDAGTVQEKTIALVQSYDSDAKTYTIITDGVAEGTATTNRYLEAVQGVTKNYYDTVGEAGATSVTAAQLKDNVDLLILGGQASMSAEEMTPYLAADGLLDKTYYCVNWSNGSAFGTTVNSVENAQNVGRILPCVYPEVLDQSDMVAYYYDTFYHLTDGVLADTIGERMDGVRNWNKADSAAYTTWEASDVSDYNHDAVQSMLQNGVGYLNMQTGLVDYLTPTANLVDDVYTVDISGYDSQLNKLDTDWGYTGADITNINANISLKSELGTLVEGTDYTVEYTDAAGVTATYPKEIGTYTMTIAGLGRYTGSFTHNVNVVPYFSVYKQTSTGDPELVYTFNSKADFEALANTGSSDYVSGLYYKGGWNVSTAKTYVTLDAVIEAAGLTYAWTDDAAVAYGGDARQGKTSNSFTKAQIDQMMFYPQAATETSSTEGAVKAPFVFALEEYASAIGEGMTAADAVAANIANANTNTAPRSVMGVLESEYVAKDGTTIAGKRLWNNITAITIKSDAVEPTPEPADQDLNFTTPQNAKVKFTALKKANQKVAITKVKGAKTDVTYSIAKVSSKAKSFSINAKNGKITIKKGLAKGTYKVTVKAKAAKSDDYNAATAKAVIKVKVK